MGWQLLPSQTKQRPCANTLLFVMMLCLHISLSAAVLCCYHAQQTPTVQSAGVLCLPWLGV